MNPAPRPPHPPPPAPGDVAPSHALNWLAEGWRLFIKAPGQWVIQALIFFVIIAALGMLPFLGWAAAPVALPVLVAGMLSGAQALDRGEPLRIDALFDGIRRHAGNLLLVGLFHLLGLLLAALVAAAIGGSAALTGLAVGALAGMGMAAGGMMLGVVAFTVLWALLMMAMWFAPALVMLHEVAPLDAMKLSVRACFHNLLAFIVLAALLYVLGWVAMIPFGLGILVLIPVIAGALYAAWKETFSALLALPPPKDSDGSTPTEAPAPDEPPAPPSPNEPPRN
ncbi:BPSS1780 family membrane protein [Thauera sp.]|uniref:BPSS1780 family membrane protein n=1 Tax=unclassified Thauera TaxID=2609274 RepID=UPI002CD6D97D|nr:BPSS1780 family membrane protein [Thauera sp.]HRP24285.1 BPSS1780 family membrane protein [Thauera sp.]